MIVNEDYGSHVVGDWLIIYDAVVRSGVRMICLC